TPQFERAGEFSEGRAQVWIGAKGGFINTKGVVIITPQFDFTMPFRYGRAAVKLCCDGPGWDIWPQNGANRYGFIDKEGKYISTPDFSWVGVSFSGDFAPIRTANRQVGIINRAGK